MKIVYRIFGDTLVYRLIHWRRVFQCFLPLFSDRKCPRHHVDCCWSHKQKANELHQLCSQRKRIYPFIGLVWKSFFFLYQSAPGWSRVGCLPPISDPTIWRQRPTDRLKSERWCPFSSIRVDLGHRGYWWSETNQACFLTQRSQYFIGTESIFATLFSSFLDNHHSTSPWPTIGCCTPCLCSLVLVFLSFSSTSYWCTDRWGPRPCRKRNLRPKDLPDNRIAPCLTPKLHCHITSLSPSRRWTRTMMIIIQAATTALSMEIRNARRMAIALIGAWKESSPAKDRGGQRCM